MSICKPDVWPTYFAAASILKWLWFVCGHWSLFLRIDWQIWERPYLGCCHLYPRCMYICCFWLCPCPFLWSSDFAYLSKSSSRPLCSRYRRWWPHISLLPFSRDWNLIWTTNKCLLGSGKKTKICWALFYLTSWCLRPKIAVWRDSSLFIVVLMIGYFTSWSGETCKIIVIGGIEKYFDRKNICYPPVAG